MSIQNLLLPGLRFSYARKTVHTFIIEGLKTLEFPAHFIDAIMKLLQLGIGSGALSAMERYVTARSLPATTAPAIEADRDEVRSILVRTRAAATGTHFTFAPAHVDLLHTSRRIWRAGRRSTMA